MWILIPYIICFYWLARSMKETANADLANIMLQNFLTLVFLTILVWLNLGISINI